MGDEGLTEKRVSFSERSNLMSKRGHFIIMKYSLNLKISAGLI